MSKWTLFSNHGHVLLYLASEPDARLRDVARAVGITERAVQKIVKDLQDGGAISISKRGRRNRYRINGRKPLRHELESHRSIGSLVKWMRKAPPPPKAVAEVSPENTLPQPGAVDPDPSPPPEPLSQPLPPVAPEPEPAQSDPLEPAPPEEADDPADVVPEEKSNSGQEKTQKKRRRKSGEPDDEQQGSLF